jgi:hypothetical protein
LSSRTHCRFPQLSLEVSILVRTSLISNHNLTDRFKVALFFVFYTLISEVSDSNGAFKWVVQMVSSDESMLTIPNEQFEWHLNENKWDICIVHLNRTILVQVHYLNKMTSAYMSHEVLWEPGSPGGCPGSRTLFADVGGCGGALGPLTSSVCSMSEVQTKGSNHNTHAQ